MSQPLISIIIPVRNGEKHIADTLDSIDKQTYENIEVIIAYDTKSTDNVLSVIKNFKCKFPIRILENDDQSIGDARNKGLSVAKGDFIWFCDGDDKLLPTSCEHLVKPLLEHEDIHVSCGSWYICYSEKPKVVNKKYNKFLKKSNNPAKYKIVNHVYAMHNLWLKRNFSIAAWAYMIRKSYIDSQGLSFPNYSHGEDQIFILKSLVNTENIARVANCIYFYKVHASSTSHLTRNGLKFWNDHEQYRSDYFNLVGNSYPSVEVVAYSDYLRWFVYELAGDTKENYYKYLTHYGIRIFPITISGSITHIAASVMFNVHPEIYRKFARIYRKIRGDPVC